MAALDSDSERPLAARLSKGTKARPPRPVADVETSIRGLQRQLRAIAARPDRADAGVNDVIDLPALAAFASLVAEAKAAEAQAVAHLRAQGFSWADIGGALGITKQSAQQRFTASSAAARLARQTAGMAPLF